jgi:protein-serine/threonine kinase
MRTLTPVAILPGADIQGHGGGDGGRNKDKLSPPLQMSKNKSLSNLALAVPDNSEKARVRMSFDAGPAASEYDILAR